MDRYGSKAHVSYHLLQVFFCIDNDSLSLPFILSLSLSSSLSLSPFFCTRSFHSLLSPLLSLPNPPPSSGGSSIGDRKEGESGGEGEGEERGCRKKLLMYQATRPESSQPVSSSIFYLPFSPPQHRYGWTMCSALGPRMVFFNVAIATGATPIVTTLKMPLPFVQVSLCVRV